MNPTDWWRSEDARLRAYLILLGVVAAWVIFPDLGAADLDCDEGIYACAVDHIRQSGNWVKLQVNGHAYFNKPPLYFWLSALTADWFSKGETAIRFWSAFFGWCAVLSTCWLGARWYRAETGLLAGGILLSNGDFLLHHGAREGCFDTGLTLLALIALLAYGAPVRQRPLGWIVIGLAVGTSCLLKPLVGLPLLILLAGHFLLTESSLLWRTRLGLPVLALVVSLVVAGPWYLLQVCLFGKAYLAEVLKHQLLQRITSGLVDVHVNGPLYYPVALAQSSVLFVLAWPALAHCLWLAWRRPRSWTAGVLAWMVLGWLVLCSASTEKVLRYVYPIYPLVCLAIAQLMESTVEAAWRRILLHWPTGVRLNPVPLLSVGLGLSTLAMQIGLAIRSEPRTYPPWQTYCQLESALEREELQFIVHRYQISVPPELYYRSRMTRLRFVDDLEELLAHCRRGPAVVLVNDPTLLQTCGVESVTQDCRHERCIWLRYPCFLVWTCPKGADRPSSNFIR